MATPARFRSIVAPMAARLRQQENASGCTGGSQHSPGGLGQHSAGGRWQVFLASRRRSTEYGASEVDGSPSGNRFGGGQLGARTEASPARCVSWPSGFVGGWTTTIPDPGSGSSSTTRMPSFSASSWSNSIAVGRGRFGWGKDGSSGSPGRKLPHLGIGGTRDSLVRLGTLHVLQGSALTRRIRCGWLHVACN